MSVKLLPRTSIGQPALDRHLALISDTLNPVLRNQAMVGQRQLLSSFTVVVPTDWVNITLSNGWTNLAGYAARIRKSADGGTIYSQGLLTVPAGPPANGSTIATLPSAYAADTSYGGGDVVIPGLQSDVANEFRVVGTTLKVGFGSALVAANWYSVFGSWTPSDRTPVVPSCFPVDVSHSLPSNPIAVLAASVVDQSNPGSTPAFPPITVQWTTTPGVKNSIRVLNIPGLIPTKTYQVSLLAIA